VTDEGKSSQNGGYINPPAIKRQHRDPYADWWDPQERRNFGEPIHEDNDVLGMFSPYEYTWTTTGPGLIMIGTFVATVLGVSGLVYLNYPDKVAYPREFEGGLQRELGGPGAVRVGLRNPPSSFLTRMLICCYRHGSPVMSIREDGLLDAWFPLYIPVTYGKVRRIDQIWLAPALHRSQSTLFDAVPPDWTTV